MMRKYLKLYLVFDGDKPEELEAALQSIFATLTITGFKQTPIKDSPYYDIGGTYGHYELGYKP